MLGNPGFVFPMNGFPRPNANDEVKKDFYFQAGWWGLLQRREVDNVAFDGRMRIDLQDSNGSVTCAATGYKVPKTAAVKVDGRWYSPSFAPDSRADKKL